MFVKRVNGNLQLRALCAAILCLVCASHSVTGRGGQPDSVLCEPEHRTAGEETKKAEAERSLESRIGSKGTSDLEKIECFALLAPVDCVGRAPSSVPEEIDAALRRFRSDQRRDHLPYLLEYGLNLHLKHLRISRLARVLPVDENLMLAELVRLTEMPKYKTAHEAGWLDRQFLGGFEKSRPIAVYSSYQIYLWYLENWEDVGAMPNFDRLVHIQKQIEQTGMHGVGGGFVCHYGCH